MDNQQYEIGRLSQAVETLAQEVHDLRGQMTEITAQLNKGKGFAFGALLFAGSIGAGIATAISNFFRP